MKIKYNKLSILALVILQLASNLLKATNINEPESELMIGQFTNNVAYLKSLKVLINSSLETVNRIDFIDKKILPTVLRGKFLDVGIGNGELTNILCPAFKETHIIDPSIEALDTVDPKNYPNKIVRKIQSTLEGYDLSRSNYDFIMISHTLYYTQRDLWKSLVQKSFDALASQGTLLIVLNNGLGRSDLTDYLGGKNVTQIERLIEECVSIKEASVKVYPFRETFEADSLENALHIASICLYDIGLKAPKETVINYLTNHYKFDNRFIIDFCQYFIILKKK